MNASFEITNATHLHLVVEKMNNFRKLGRLCDITLVVGDKKICGHRIVLALCSPWFDQQLESKEDTIIIDNDINYEIMSIIVDYMYTGTIKFSLEDAVKVWKSLEHLQMEPVLRFCEKYFMDNIDEDSCMELFVLSEELDCKDLKNATVAYMAKHFKSLGDSFKQLTESQLEAVLTAAVDCNSAQAIYQVIVTWLKFREDRHHSIEALMKFVKVENLSGTVIRKTILTDSYFKLHISGRQWLVDSFLCDTSPIVRDHQVLNIFPVNAGNWSYDFDVSGKCLTKHPQTTALNFRAMVKNKDTIYALGGKEKGVVSYGILKYDTVRREWNKICDKKFTGICTGGDKIYLIDGSDRNNKTCSIFDIARQQLINISNMEHSRYLPGVSYYNSSVYVFGGMSYQSPSYAIPIGMSYQFPGEETIVERYDTREGKWSTHGKCQIRSICSSATIFNSIICLEKDSGKIIKYDPRSGNSYPVTNHPGHSIASLNDNLYLAHNNGISKFNPYDNQWIDIRSIPLESSILVG